MALSALAVVRLVSAFHLSTLSGKKCNLERITPKESLSRTNLEKDTTDLDGQDWVVIDPILQCQIWGNENGGYCAALLNYMYRHINKDGGNVKNGRNRR